METSNNEKQHQMTFGIGASAPLPAGAYSSQYVERGLPPSYEESQKSYGVPLEYPELPRPAPPQYLSSVQPTMSAPAQSYGYSAYAPPPMPQPQDFYKPFAMTPVGVVPSSCPAGPPLCTLAKGAEVRYTPTGAVSIPPPPPGCAPTAAQLAAMQGLPVLLQKMKRSFF